MTKGIVVLLLTALPAQLRSAELKVLLPQDRVAYQTNESVAVAVLRNDAQPLAAADLTLTVRGDDGSRLVFTFPLTPVAVEGKTACATEHLSIDARLLRPGKYTLEAAAYGTAATARIEVYSHVRRSTYRVVHWASGADKEQQGLMGEDGLGYNLLLNTQPPTDYMVRGGLDFMGNCLMGGMHQHDGRAECDWSDPYATGGAVQRVMVRAYAFRTWGNAIGAHLHDEPGLTWVKHPHSGKFTAADVPAQRAAYQRALGAEPIWQDQVDVNNPQSLARWIRAADFKLGYMDAFWRQARYALEKMKPGFLSVTQSQYGWNALADGYYFNVARSLPVICGHGGYDDYGLRTLNPVWYLEFALPRQMQKPTWYLPEWFSQTSEQFRAEHYVCFATGIQGVCTPPMSPWNPAAQPCTDGIVEANKVFLSLGPIFARNAITRGDVAILYSKSSAEYAMGKDRSDRYDEQWEKLAQIYLAAKMTQYPATVVLDEDVIDGTVAANHKAVVLTAVHYLDPAVKAGLEGFAAAGGAVLVTDDCTVPMAGSVKIGNANQSWFAAAKEQLARIQDGRQKQEANERLLSLDAVARAVQPAAQALRTALRQRGLRPAFETDAPGLAAARQTRGEIDYLFAVNFTPTANPAMPLRAVEAAIKLPTAGRTVYDAVRGGPCAELDPSGATGKFRFGAGQMRVFALAARTIGGVQVAPPVVSADFSRDADPIAVEVGAALLDTKGGLLAGTAPMQIRLTDPLGEVRYDLYRASDQGLLKLALPLAANDPAGQWKVTVKELLNNSESSNTFIYRPAAVCGAAAGAVPRAMLFLPDRNTIYDLFQSHKAFTIVKGAGEDVAAAAKRLAQILEPYDVHCTIVDASAVKTRELSQAEARTWTSYGGGAGGPLANGYDLPGPAILIGNSQNNPLVAVVAQAGKWHPQLPNLMPYLVNDAVPGRGRGMIGWHLYPLGRRLETVTLVANDAQGLSEAVGTLLEIVAGLEPLVPATPPANSRIAAANMPRPEPKEAAIAWQTVLPDRAAAIQADGEKIVVATIDGSRTTLDASGKIVGQQAAAAPVIPKPPVVDPKTLPHANLPPGATGVSPGATGVSPVSGANTGKPLPPSRIAKWTATAGDLTAVGYWGGAVEVMAKTGQVKARRQLPQDIACLAWHKTRLIVGLADGKVVALTAE
jgi:hypothetical protein